MFKKSGRTIVFLGITRHIDELLVFGLIFIMCCNRKSEIKEQVLSTDLHLCYHRVKAESCKTKFGELQYKVKTRVRYSFASF